MNTRPNLEMVTRHFRKHYSGPPIAFFIAGGGFSALDFRRFPGGSRVFHTSIEPYSDDTVNFLNQYANANIQDPNSFRFVNEEGTQMALRALQNYCGRSDLLFVVINSALTTDRYRRGENRAYISTSLGENYEFQLNRLDEESYRVLATKGSSYIDEIRQKEDIKVGQAALAIIMNDPSLAPELEPGEVITLLKENSSFSS